MESNDIEKLSALARIELTEGEATTFKGEMDTILGYIGHVREVTHCIDATTDTTVGDVRGITRSDEAHTPFSADSVREAFPKQHDGYLAVKKVLDQ